MPLLETLSPGPNYSLTQNQVYALPASTVFIIANEAVEFSMNVGSGFAAVAASSTGFQSSWPYVRATTTTAKISVKRY